MKSDPKVLSRCQTITATAALFAAASGAIVLVGWILGNASLESLLSPGVAMKGNTAMALIAVGSALWMLRRGPIAKAPLALLGRALALLVLLFGLLTLSEHISGVNLHIDQLLFTEPPGAVATASPGRMGL